MKCSIVIPSFNSQEFIAYTIESVLFQKYRNIELIIVDGGSRDDTIKIIKSYGQKITKFISEPDRGVFDALNKGIKIASGDVIGWLGSDDFYIDDSVVDIAMKTIVNKNVEMCWGDLIYVDRKNPNRIVRFWKSSEYKEGKFKKGWQLPHFASFIKKDVLEKYGGFNLDFPIAADYELMLRLLEKHKVKSYYIPKALVKMRTGGQSNKNITNIIKANIECYQAWRTNGLEINPLIFFLKPASKVIQYFKKP